MGRLNNLFVLLGIMTLAAGCATSRLPSSHIPPQNPSAISANQDLSDARAIVLHHAVNSIGAPYAWGGSSPATGFDCSGLVTYTHSQAGITLPRTASAQFDQGRPVRSQGLMPGDLVFFKSGSKKSGYHVGIYTGQHQFVHAPGRGRRVIQSAMTNPYFKTHYIGARSFF